MPDIVAVALTIRRVQQDGERETAGEIWQQTKDMPSLIFTGRYGTPIDPRTLNRKFVARCEAAGVRPITVHDARHTCATLNCCCTLLLYPQIEASDPESECVSDQAFC